MASNHIKRWLRASGVGAALIAILAMVVPSAVASAQAVNDQGFEIQVSPATVAITLSPGKQKSTSIIVRNLSNHAERLVPKLSGFKIDQASEKIELDHTPPANMSGWVSFGQPELDLKAGESKTLEVRYNTPATVGFSYAAAITLSRVNEVTTVAPTGARLRGTVAIFTLINIDRPDAKRQLTIESFTSAQGTYEFLPATFNLTVKNNGNVIDQPAGNIFIQRSFHDTTPIATIPINATGGYILPGTSRTLTVEWKNGFPVSVNTADKGKPTNKRLKWDWKNANQLRIGRYTAKAVLVYNDGQRDVPVITSVNFWVMPWRVLIILLIVIVVLLMGLFGWGRLIAMGTKKVRRYAVRK